jgi:phenylalanyl-tRNA synthetase beta subunit
LRGHRLLLGVSISLDSKFWCGGWVILKFLVKTLILKEFCKNILKNKKKLISNKYAHDQSQENSFLRVTRKIPQYKPPPLNINLTFIADEEIDDISFSYGLESEKDDDPEWYRVELPANRYDLLSAEGLSMALAQYLDIKSYPKFAIANPPQLLKMTVSKSTEQIRPVCVCAVLRNLTFTQDNYDSFIDFQDKLHHNLGRRRTIVSIGTHDLDTIEGPFTYEALAPQDIKFVPLNKTQAVDGNELMKMYEEDMQLKAFLHIVRDSPVYPVIKDGKGRVCSLPPIINGDHSKITFNTKNVFIECTATDWTKARMAVNLLCQAFSIYSSTKGSIEQVEVTLPSGETIITPDIGERSVACNLEFMNTAGGIFPFFEMKIKNK